MVVSEELLLRTHHLNRSLHVWHSYVHKFKTGCVLCLEEHFPDPDLRSRPVDCAVVFVSVMFSKNESMSSQMDAIGVRCTTFAVATRFDRVNYVLWH